MDAAGIRRALDAALRAIAEDIAAAFNARLDALAREDPHVEALVPRYAIDHEHVAELAAALREPLASLFDRLDAADLDGARAKMGAAWPRLERRIQAKWQSYFVLTFQEVSVERKATRDRVRPTIDPAAAELMAQASAARRALPEVTARWEPAPARLSTWVAVLALLAAAAVAGWLLLRGHLRHSAAAAKPPPTSPR